MKLANKSLRDEIHQIETDQFDYLLPDEQIAKFPLAQRDSSKLLVFRNGAINHRIFRELPDCLPNHSFLVFNNTKVLPARLFFTKETGTTIEVLLISYQVESGNRAACHCMVGNKKRWKDGEVLERATEVDGRSLIIQAGWKNREENIIVLEWDEHPGFSLPEVLQAVGQMPIPPYLNREAEESDKTNYQTVYAKKEGAIAAPTAGLHFTPEVLENLGKKGMGSAEITLHVGLGTFRPMKTTRVADHEMHEEEVVISTGFLEKLAAHHGPVIAVGTTSIRSLESLYWIASEWAETGTLLEMLETHQPYDWANRNETFNELFGRFAAWLKSRNQKEIRFYTRLFLVPGYQYRVVNGLITNFHQPKSTLLVLIASFIGDAWKQLYQEATEKQYRFLSYGDSSLLIP